MAVKIGEKEVVEEAVELRCLLLDKPKLLFLLRQRIDRNSVQEKQVHLVLARVAAFFATRKQCRNHNGNGKHNSLTLNAHSAT